MLKWVSNKIRNVEGMMTPQALVTKVFSLTGKIKHAISRVLGKNGNSPEMSAALEDCDKLKISLLDARVEALETAIELATARERIGQLEWRDDEYKINIRLSIREKITQLAEFYHQEFPNDTSLYERTISRLKLYPDIRRVC